MPQHKITKPLDPHRFLAKVEKTSDCWNWVGTKLRDGYGYFYLGGWPNPKHMLAHRASYEMFVGPVPGGLELDHLCRNHGCVNPAHLEAVTHKENMMRGRGVGSENAVKTHCKNGHEFSAENTYVRPGRIAGRSCRACGRRVTANYLRKKAAQRSAA